MFYRSFILIILLSFKYFVFSFYFFFSTIIKNTSKNNLFISCLLPFYHRYSILKREVSNDAKTRFLEKPYDYMNDILLFLYNNKGQATRNELVDFFNISLPTLNEYLSF